MPRISDNECFIIALRESGRAFPELTVAEQGIVLLRVQELKNASDQGTRDSFLPVMNLPVRGV